MLSCKYNYFKVKNLKKNWKPAFKTHMFLPNQHKVPFFAKWVKKKPLKQVVQNISASFHFTSCYVPVIFLPKKVQENFNSCLSSGKSADLKWSGQKDLGWKDRGFCRALCLITFSRFFYTGAVYCWSFGIKSKVLGDVNAKANSQTQIKKYTRCVAHHVDFRSFSQHHFSVQYLLGIFFLFSGKWGTSASRKLLLFFSLCVSCR